MTADASSIHPVPLPLGTLRARRAGQSGVPKLQVGDAGLLDHPPPKADGKSTGSHTGGSLRIATRGGGDDADRRTSAGGASQRAPLPKTCTGSPRSQPDTFSCLLLRQPVRQSPYRLRSQCCRRGQACHLGLLCEGHRAE
jgi:hypothetical protein